MSFWKPSWKPTPEEQFYLTLSSCEIVKNILLRWNKKNFIIACCLKQFIIYIFAENDIGFNLESTKFSKVETINNCGPIDVLTFVPLLDKVIFYDSRIPEEKMADLFLVDDSFTYKESLHFEASASNSWICKEKNIWLIACLGCWKTAKYTDRQTIYANYNTFEEACEAILNS